MRFARSFFLWFGSAGGVVLLHLVTTSILETPWNRVNMIFVFLIVLLLMRENGIVVWVSFVAHFFIELYTANPFGILLFSGTVATLFAFWLYQYVFTNQSWYTAATLSFLTILLYRTLYTILLGVGSFFSAVAMPPWRFLLSTYAWEIILTSVATAGLYMLITWPMQPKKRTLPFEWRV